MWDHFIPSINDEESTISNAFCLSNLFKISSDNKVNIHPKVKAINQNNKIVLSIDSNLYLIDNKDELKCHLISFKSIIECITITPSENLVLCCLNDGNIHGISLNTATPLFNVSIGEEHIKTEQTFLGIYPIKDQFYISCTNGGIYRLSNIDETIINEHEIIKNDNETINATIIDNVTLKFLTKFECLNEDIVICSLILNPIVHDTDIMVITATKNYLKFQYKNDLIRIQLPDYIDGVKKIFKLENYILALSKSGNLFEICPYTYTIQSNFNNNNLLINDLVVIEDNYEKIELLLLTKINEQNTQNIKIIDFPSFKCMQEFSSMIGYIWLVNQSKMSVNLYYLNSLNLNDANIPQDIEMKLISELDPKQIFKKLIYKGHFNEAEEFGKQYNLSLQPIYEMKVKKILNEINFMNINNIDLELKFNNLLKLLKLIENQEFFISIHNTNITDRKVMKSYLDVLLERLNDNEKYEDEILNIKEQLLRIETLNIIDPYETNMEWHKFVQHSDLLQICISYFKKDMLNACLIWKRHASCIIQHLNNDNNIIKLLNMIPTNIEPILIIQWLRTFVPSIVHINSNSITIIIEWYLNKIKSLQYSNYWPDIGLEFTKDIKQIFQSLNFLYSDINHRYEENMIKLTTLIETLNDLFILKKEYKIYLTLDNYSKESIDDTAFHILQRTQLNDLQKIIHNFLHKIYLNNGERISNAITIYIEFLISKRRKISFWLERSIICIDALHNEDEKLKYCLMVLKVTPVPWPLDKVKSLLKLRNINHPLSNDIEIQYELQLIKIIRIKYEWPLDINENDNMKLICRIIKLKLPNMLSDLINVIKLSTINIKENANFYCCYELIRTNLIDLSIKYFDQLNEEYKKKCIDKFINIFCLIIDTDINCTTLNYQDYFEFFKFVIPKLSSSSSSSSRLTTTAIENNVNITEYANNDYQNIFEILESTYILRTKYQLKLSYMDLYSIDKCKSLFNEFLINNLLLNIQNYDKPIMKILEIINNLCKLLKLNLLYAFIELCKKLNNIKITCSVAYNIIQLNDYDQNDINTVDSELYIDFAMLLISQHIISTYNENEDKIHNMEYDPLVYPLSNQLLRIALKCDKYKLHVVEILKWIRIGSYLYPLNVVHNFYENDELINENIKKSLNNSLNEDFEKSADDVSEADSILVFEKVTDTKDMEMPKYNPENTLKCVSLGQLVVLIELKPTESVLNRLWKFIPTDYLNLNNEIKTKFYQLLEKLMRSKRHSCWYSIAELFLYYQKFSNKVLLNRQFISLHLKRAFRDMLSEREPDFTYLFVILLSELSPDTFLKELSNELKYEQQKIHYLQLSEMYNNFMKNTNEALMDRERRLKYYYWNELCKLDHNLKTKYDTKQLKMEKILQLLRTNVLNLKLLEKMCKDFKWDHQELLISQIIIILNSQELKFDVKIDAFNNEELIVITTTDNIYKLCEVYINEITDYDQLATELLKLLTKINYYFYELYICIINILKLINKLPKTMELWNSILLFLKDKMIKKRKHKYTQLENDYWVKLQKYSDILPKISKYRYPFIPIIKENNIENILGDEINVNTCENWIPLIQLHIALHHGITANEQKMIELEEYFCMTAVKNSTLELWQLYEQNLNEKWNLYPINSAFLQSVLRITKYIKNHSKILFILYFVTTHSPDGADQVNAAYECYKYAIDNENIFLNEQNQKALETIKKIKKKYPFYKIQHILHLNNLIDDKLIQLIDNPKELIISLYNHEIILETSSSSIKSNINKICEDIAKLFNLNLIVIQLYLLHKWLAISMDDDNINDLDETFCTNLIDNDNSFYTNTENINHEDVIRATYILSSWESSKAVNFLISNVFPTNGQSNTGKQLQNIECIIHLISDKTITFLEIINQKQYMTIKCVHYLNQFGYNFTIEKFNNYKKLTILKNLWKNYAKNSNALEVMVYICLLYDINTKQIWNGLLKQMIELKMLKQLDAVVEILSCKKSILFIEGLSLAWNYVLRAPFKNANFLCINENEENLLNAALIRIQSCPLIGKLNFLDICEDCIRINRINYAAILIGLCLIEEEKDKIKKIVAKHINDNLKTEITELREIGILQSIINYVLKELNLEK